jgi:hypothetical protein
MCIGGGFIVGGSQLYATQLDALRRGALREINKLGNSNNGGVASLTIFSLEYPLSPEQRFPAAIHVYSPCGVTPPFACLHMRGLQC